MGYLRYHVNHPDHTWQLPNMSAFIHENFLLSNSFSETLYHRFAAKMPIIDYHCHLPPARIASDHRFTNITELWLEDDHYKWRVMRTLGISEHFCTGQADDKEKFLKFASIMPQLYRNPIYHWTHMELKRYFDIDTLLSTETAEAIWTECNEKLALPEFSCRHLLLKSNVEIVCTTDNPLDDLSHHKACASDSSFPVSILPTWRPDAALDIRSSDNFITWVNQLSETTATDVHHFDGYLEALRIRLNYFHDSGCRLSDHGLDPIFGNNYRTDEIELIYAKALRGNSISPEEHAMFQSAMLFELGKLYHEKGWVQQYHIGALRKSNHRQEKALGGSKGFDSIGDWSIAEALSAALNRLDVIDSLPRTIIYSLNPKDNEAVASIAGSFQDGEITGKIQMGSGWWFLDQLDGMIRNLEAQSQLGVLSCFIGMLTDSRSMTSYVRHEYFRRLLCDLLGRDLKEGKIPNDMENVGKMVSNICYHNARSYFRFPKL